MMLSVSATFAADDVVAVDDGIAEETLTTEVVDDSGELSDDATNVVTKDNFGDFFDSSGTLTSDADELVFEGDFSGLDISSITIAGDAPVKFTGRNATFKNVQFQIMQSGVTINGFNFVTDESNQHSRLIWMLSDEEMSDIILSNNNITFIAPSGDDAYAIFAGAEEAMGTSVISGLDIINNNIIFVGADETKKNNVIRVNGNTYDEDWDYAPSESITVQGNTFDIQMPSIPIGYDQITYAANPMSEGIVFYYCNDVKFNGNKVNIRYNKAGGAFDTINVIAVYSDMMVAMMEGPCMDIEIKGNTITGAGHNSIYGIKVSADNFKVSDNIITLTSEDYYANGISVDGPASNGNVQNNTISLSVPTEKPTTAYGIYAWQMYGGIEDVEYVDNNISVEGYLACGMEINQPDAVITNNNIVADGNFTYGIAASIRPAGDCAEISKNTISCSGNNVGFGSGDPILKTGSAGISTLGSALISNNKINSTSIGVVCVDEGQVILSSNEINVEAVGKWDNYAVKVTSVDKLDMAENTINFVGTTDGSVVTNGVYIFETQAQVSDNKFNLVIPAADIVYGPAPTYEETIIAEGIVIDYVDNLLFTGNNVTVTYGDVVGYYDTIRAIDVSNSNGVNITDNRINAVGNQYIYALKLTGMDFIIEQNEITATSNNYANGINIESPSYGAIVLNNISATSPHSAYPIYAGMNGQDLNIAIISNNISGEAYFVVGIEIGGDQTIIFENNIEVKGNHTIGVGAFVNELTVTGNNIRSIASNEGNEYIWDNVPTETTGINVLKGNFSIQNNYIETTGEYAAILGDNNGTVVNNMLLANLGVGDDAVIGLGNVNVSGNPKTANRYLKVILVADDLTKVQGSASQFVVKVFDENGKAVANKTIEFLLNGVRYTQTTDLNGIVKFNVNVAVGKYVVTTKFAGDDEYGAKTITNNIVVTAKPVVKKATKITAKKKTFKAKTKVKKYTITLKAGKAAVKKVKVTLKIKGKTYKATTNSKGKATFKIKKLTKKGRYTAKIKFAGNKLYKAASKSVKITVKK